VSNNSIIVEIQKDALNEGVSVEALVRKAYLAAKKLGLEDFSGWARGELSGYEPGGKIPEFRKISGEIKARNPFHGWQPIVWNTAKAQKTLEEKLSNIRICQSIGELEQIYISDPNGLGHMSIGAEAETALRKAIDHNVPIVLEVTTSQLKGILSRVRQYVLDWAIELEKMGVKGEGLTFSEAEKTEAKKADLPQSIHIGHIEGGIQISHGNISNTSHITVNTLVQEIEDSIDGLDITKVEKQQISNLVGEIRKEGEKSKPEPSIIKAGFQKIVGILKKGVESGVAQALASKVSDYLKMYVG